MEKNKGKQHCRGNRLPNGKQDTQAQLWILGKDEWSLTQPLFGRHATLRAVNGQKRCVTPKIYSALETVLGGSPREKEAILKQKTRTRKITKAKMMRTK